MLHCTKHEGHNASCPSLGFPSDRVTVTGLPPKGLLVKQSQGTEATDCRQWNRGGKNNFWKVYSQVAPTMNDWDLILLWPSDILNEPQNVCLRNIGRHVYPLALMPHRSSHLRVSLSPFQTPYMCTMRVSTGISWIRILQSWDAGGVHIAEFATAAVIRIKDGLGEPEVGNKRWPTDFLFNTVN